MAKPFTFPQIFEFPPFFSKQINERTWNAQLGYWDTLILGYCAHYRVWTLDVNEDVAVNGQPLFSNPRINRSLKKQTVQSILEYMVGQGHAEWLQDKTTVLVYFKRPDEWATLIANYIDSTGQGGTVVTLYELSEGDLVQSQEFCNINPIMLRRAIDILVSRKRAVLMKGPDGKEIEGVKMF